jgi:hypothetical protein
LIRSLLILASVLSFVVGASAQRQVAFLGENFTYAWGHSRQFKAHKNWLDYGDAAGGGPGYGNLGTFTTLGVLQTIIASGKKPIIHLVVGQTNADALSPGNEASVAFAGWAQGFEEIIKTAQEAKLEIIVGTIPYAQLDGNVGPMNQWIFLYCNAHGVPVVNYSHALNSGTGFAASGRGAMDPEQPPIPQVPVYYQQPISQPGGTPQYQLTSQGYDLITDMAEVAIGLVSNAFKLKSGYLDTVYLPDLEDPTSQASVNTGIDGAIVQFTPYGQYTDGSTHVINNADQYGHIGTWTTSSQTVLNIDQNGVGTPLDAGTANVHFTTLAGQTISEWVWHTTIFDKCGCTSY